MRMMTPEVLISLQDDLSSFYMCDMGDGYALLGLLTKDGTGQSRYLGVGRFTLAGAGRNGRKRQARFLFFFLLIDPHTDFFTNVVRALCCLCDRR